MVPVGRGRAVGFLTMALRSLIWSASSTSRETAPMVLSAGKPSRQMLSFRGHIIMTTFPPLET